MGSGTRVGFFAVFAVVLCVGSVPAKAETLRVAGSGSTQRVVERLGAAFESSQPGVGVQVELVRGLGSRGAIRALVEGVVQVAVRAISPGPEDGGQGLASVEWARTPVVFATGRTNASATGVRLAWLIDVYAGRTGTWPDGSRVRLVLRPLGDSDTALVRVISKEMSAADDAARSRAGLRVAATDQEMGDALAETPGALGTTTLALIVSERRPLKPLTFDGREPTLRSVADGTYPLVKSFELVTKAPTTAAAERFVAFAKSPEAAKILAAHGFLEATRGHRP